MQREDSINLITLFSNFWRYKWSVLMILIFILTLTFFYIKQIVPVYSSNILITIESDEASSIKSIFPNSNVVNIDMESRLDYDIAILKSRHIISKVLDNIELSHRFFIKGQWREQELYREEIPFELDLNNKRSDSGSFEFTLKELDRETFTLGLNAKEKKNQYYKYNQTIEIEGYQLKISKKNPTIYLGDTKYSIKIENNKNILISNILNNLSIKKEVNKILDISYEDIVPRRAKDILTQLISSYKKYNLNSRQLKDVSNIVFFDKMILELEDTLKEIGDKLKGYKSKHSELLVIGSEDKFFFNIIEKNHDIANLSLKLNALKMTKERIQNGIYSISLLENSDIRTEDIKQLIDQLRGKNINLNLLYKQKNSINTLIVNSTDYQNILQELKKTEKDLRELSSEYTTEYPEVKRVQTDITALQRELRSYIRNHIIIDRKETIRLKEEIDKTIKALINSVEKEYSSVTKSLKKDKTAIDKLPKSTMRLEELKREFKLNEKNHEILLQKRSEALISKASTISNIQIVDTPICSTHSIEPKKNFLYFSGLLLGLILSIVYTSFRIYINKSIYSENDISSPTYSLLYNKERELKTNLWTLVAYLEGLTLFEKSKIVLITTNAYEENKSLICKELSLELVNISKKVLIIDFDIYHPNLSNGLNKSLSKGLSTLLTSKHDFDEINIEHYINYNYKNIDILSSGPIIPNSSTLLFNPKIKPLLESLSKKYDYILIDAPPIGKYPVTAILLKYIDIFLVVAKIKKTDKIFFEKLNEIDGEDLEKIVFLTD